MRMSRLVVASIFAACLIGMGTGCQPEEPVPNYTRGRPSADGPATEGVPLVAEGRNVQLTYKTKHAGRLLLYDPDSNQFLFKGRLEAGQQFVFEPASGVASIDKERIDLDHPTNNRDNYQIYFAEK